MRAERILEKLIKDIKQHSKFKQLPGKEPIAFLKAFFDRGPADDLTAYQASDLAGLVAASWKFAAKRQPGRHKVSVVDPSVARDGWQCEYTTIAILTDDMPFLLDSVLGALTERGLNTHLVLHPILTLRRNDDGALTKLTSKKDSGSNIYRESLMHIHVDRLGSRAERQDLEAELSSVLDDIRTVVLDWPLMRERVKDVIAEFQNAPPPMPVDELAEAIQFLDWLGDNNFTFLGIRQYRFDGGRKAERLLPVKGSGLGILRDAKVHVLRRGRDMVSITPEVREFLMQPAALIITKANVRAVVHRRVHMDYIGIKQFDVAGKLTGELRVIGLFTSTAYTRNPSTIPLLRRKIAEVMERSRVIPSSHSGKALLNVLENYPRDELFQIDTQKLTEIANGIHQLSERPRSRIFVRRDKFDRFVSVLVFVPRDRYNTTVRQNVGDLLAETFKGRVSAYYPSYPEGILVRVHFIIGRYEGVTPSPNLDKLEAKIAALARTWNDDLKDALLENYDNSSFGKITARYLDAFTAAYQEAYSSADALADIRQLEKLDTEQGPGVDFYRGPDEDNTTLRLKIYNRANPISLSDRLPILENFGLKAINERSYRIVRNDSGAKTTFWLHDIVLRTADGESVPLKKVKTLLEEGYLAIWRGLAENDRYNSLMLQQALPWRDVTVLRACSKYLRQTGIAYSQDYMSAALVRHSKISRLLVELFYSRFSLDKVSADARRRQQKSVVKKIEHALNAVSSLDEDRIVRRFINLIHAMWRTNFFQLNADGKHRAALAFKVNSQAIDGLPEPRPHAEIFVYAPDVEGVHLRGGKIARGGLRWSDRPEDFRTEVLGLAKAQQVKNAVIVPVGAKGGFVPKNLPVTDNRNDIIEEAIRCYKIFISSLLDVTDNLQGKKVLPPKRTIRHDGDDPYLVVAADKGTATFSDIANALSQGRQFWMDDAFASGGSAGYDHKKMGITARGGWEAVKRHFRELDIDIQTTPFRVIGVGDMSGDVFGNGMLLSKQIKLVAAFDHRDIFIDPEPNPAKSHAERARMFDLPRSTWRDYSSKLISKGGGIFSRAEKSITLTPEIKAMTGLKTNQATPNDLINAILKMSADLLWFGGIGTYVRSSKETDREAGDRTNDEIRVTAKELNVKAIGEGANLGITQLGRIEFAENGGRINTDAVDNSAGVNSSDVEVNIKIALGAAEIAGKLTRPKRNKFLVEMTDEVAQLVLRNNYQQTLSLTLAQLRAVPALDYHARFMRDMEADGKLNRAVEFLPDENELSDRRAAGTALTRPELSVLLAYAKITLFDQLLDSEVPDDPHLGAELQRYFPVKLQERFGPFIATHRLRREIISTMLANSMINRGGPLFVYRLADETGANVSSIAAAYALARDSFSLGALNSEIDMLDNKVSSEVQLDLYLTLQDLLREMTILYLRNNSADGRLSEEVERFRSGIATLESASSKILPPGLQKIVGHEQSALSSKGVPKSLAEKIAHLKFLKQAPNIITVAQQTSSSLELSATIFFKVGQLLQISDLIDQADKLDILDYFERLARDKQIDSLTTTQRGLTANILIGSKGDLAAWQDDNAEPLRRTKDALRDVFASGSLTLAKLAVASGHVRELLDG